MIAVWYKAENNKQLRQAYPEVKMKEASGVAPDASF
jgi:hypothetical protein